MKPDDPVSLVREADRLCDEADDLLFNEESDLGDRLASQALRFYRRAARASLEPERTRLYLRAAHVAGTLERHKTVVSIVREACRACDPDYEQEQELRGHWDCSNWTDEPFPEIAPRGSKTLFDRKGPIPGQMSIPGIDCGRNRK